MPPPLTDAAAPDDLLLRVLTGLHEVPAAAWDRLAGPQPFVSHAYLAALETTGCVGTGTGWLPQHLTLWQRGELVGAMPLYVKSHSYGEYVFDWAWADAYQRHGLDYYPKLVCAVPFTPISGPRLLVAAAGLRRVLIDAALAHARALGASSLHCLFPARADSAALQQAGLLLRRGFQFHWQNAGYRSFADYLAGMNHRKRKNIAQERRRVSAHGFVFQHKRGADISAADWELFAACYAHTYRAHRAHPYLNLAFFKQLGAALPQHVLLIVACRDDQRVAAALNIMDRDTLYGRYWGALEAHPGLHFETCYYQAIEFCIAHGLARFEGGAQGEHKLARGFLPVATESAHWLARPDFAAAIDHYLQQETAAIDDYLLELAARQPFKEHDTEGSSVRR